MKARMVPLLAGVIGMLSGVIGIATFVERTTQERIMPRLRPWITVIRPDFELPSNEYLFQGRYRHSSRDLKVRLYVHPHDKRNRYWLQPAGLEHVKQGTWVESARLGNPNCADQVSRDGVFSVYAVLVGAAFADSVPQTDAVCPWVEAPGDSAFRALVMQSPGVVCVSLPCEVKRRCADCTVPTVELPKENEILTLPVRLRWAEQHSMYVEIRNGGCLYLAGIMNSDTLVSCLTEGGRPGHSSAAWEVKVSRIKGDGCQAVRWFALRRAEECCLSP